MTDVVKPINYNIKLQKEQTIKSLYQKISTAKLDMIKTILNNNGIVVKNDAKSVDDILAYIEKNDITNLKIANQLIERISQSMDDLLSELEKNSMNAFQKFVQKAESIVSPISKTLTKTMATRTAMMLAPTVVSKLALSAGIMLIGNYKLSKNSKKHTILTKKAECERILQELEITTFDNKVIDTRFDSTTQEAIRGFLKEHNIEFVDSGYLSLRQTINDLDYETKVELCVFLNNLLNKNIDITSRLDSRKTSFFDKLKNASKKIRDGSVVGAVTASTINSIDPAIIAGPLNGTIAGYITSKLSENDFLTKISGLLGTVGTICAERLPFVGDDVQRFLRTENVVALSIAGGGLGAIGIGVSSVMIAFKNLKKRFEHMKNNKEIMEFDKEKYAEFDQQEISKRILLLKEKQPSEEEQLIIDLVWSYMHNKDKNNSKKPENIVELSNIIKMSDEGTKRDLVVLFERLRDSNNKNYYSFWEKLKRVWKTTTTLTLMGLSAISLVDIIKDGTILPQISNKLFNGIENKVSDMRILPEIEHINKTPLNQTDTKILEGMSESELTTAETQYSELQSFLSEGTVAEKIVENQNSTIEEGVMSWLKLFAQGQMTKENIDQTGLAINPTETETLTTPYSIKEIFGDRKRIEPYINNLSIEERTNLAYYFNSRSSQQTNETFGDIAATLSNKENFGAIKEYIKHNNIRTKISKGLSTLLEAVTPLVTLGTTIKNEEMNFEQDKITTAKHR